MTDDIRSVLLGALAAATEVVAESTDDELRQIKGWYYWCIPVDRRYDLEADFGPGVGLADPVDDVETLADFLWDPDDDDRTPGFISDMTGLEYPARVLASLAEARAPRSHRG